MKSTGRRGSPTFNTCGLSGPSIFSRPPPRWHRQISLHARRARFNPLSPKHTDPKHGSTAPCTWEDFLSSCPQDPPSWAADDPSLHVDMSGLTFPHQKGFGGTFLQSQLPCCGRFRPRFEFPCTFIKRVSLFKLSLFNIFFSGQLSPTSSSQNFSPINFRFLYSSFSIKDKSDGGYCFWASCWIFAVCFFLFCFFPISVTPGISLPLSPLARLMFYHPPSLFSLIFGSDFKHVLRMMSHFALAIFLLLFQILSASHA